LEANEEHPLATQEFEDDRYGDEAPPPPEELKDADWTVQAIRTERTVYDMYRRWQRGHLILNPNFERQFIWKERDCNRLVESVLLRIPLPAFYLSAEVEDRVVVIDGLQRLTSLFRYLDGKYSLRNLELLPRLNNKLFIQLEVRYQRRIEDTPLSIVELQPGTDELVKYHLFDRLNRGGLALTPQEIRNGIYRGKGLDLVNDLAASDAFLRVAGKSRSYSRMRAAELVLRCMAFMLLGLEEYKGDLDRYLNKALIQMNRKESEESLQSLRHRFLRSLRSVQVVYGTDAFRRFDPTSGRPFPLLNAAIMDVMVQGFSSYEKAPGEWAGLQNRLIEVYQRLHDNQDFVDAITSGTGSVTAVTTRFTLWQKAVDDVARNYT